MWHRRGPGRTGAAFERWTPSGGACGIRQPNGPEAASLSGEGEERDLPLYGRRAQPARDVRLQAQAPGVRRQTDPRFAGGRQAIRVYGRVRQGPAEGAGLQDRIQTIWPERRMGVEPAAEYLDDS